MHGYFFLPCEIQNGHIVVPLCIHFFLSFFVAEAPSILVIVLMDCIGFILPLLQARENACQSSDHLVQDLEKDWCIPGFMIWLIDRGCGRIKWCYLSAFVPFACLSCCLICVWDGEALIWLMNPGIDDDIYRRRQSTKPGWKCVNTKEMVESDMSNQSAATSM